MSQESIPTNSVIGVLSQDTECKAAIQELTSLGYDDYGVYRGEDFAEQVDPNAEHANLLSKVGNVLAHHLSEQPNFLAQYQEEARAGNSVLAVHVKDHEEALAVKTVIERHHGTNLRFFGRFAVADLSPDSNPSKPSDASAEVTANKEREARAS